MGKGGIDIKPKPPYHFISRESLLSPRVLYIVVSTYIRLDTQDYSIYKLHVFTYDILKNNIIGIH